MKKRREETEGHAAVRFYLDGSVEVTFPNLHDLDEMVGLVKIFAMTITNQVMIQEMGSEHRILN